MARMTLTLLHTAEAHRATFDALRDRIAPDVTLHHILRPDFLSRAQEAMTEDLISEIKQEIHKHPTPVLCTCTTLGPIAESAGALRIDAPMMQAAADSGGPVLMVYCLDSTRAPSLALLTRALQCTANPHPIHALPLLSLWPLFAADNHDDFARAIARETRNYLAQHPDITAIVLAQVSMAGAARYLTDLAQPVLTSPEPALRAALARL